MSRRFELSAVQLPAPGGRMLLRLERYSIALFHVDGRYHAIDDSCPHQGASLIGGKLEGRSIQCPAHGLHFDLGSGCMKYAPEVAVAVYLIEAEQGKVYLHLPDQES